MIKTIPVSELRPGMYVHSPGRCWLYHPMWRSQFLVRDDDARASLLEAGIREVEIDLTKGLDVLEPSHADAVAGADPTTSHRAAHPAFRAPGQDAHRFAARQTAELAIGSAALAQIESQDADRGRGDTPAGGQSAIVVNASAPQRISRAESREAPRSLHAELTQARRLIAESRGEVTRMFSEARMGKIPATDAVAELTDEIAASIARNQDAMISLARLKSADDYTYMHSVAVCGLMIALARELELPEEQVRKAGVAGLLHDIGKMVIPSEILNKPGKLTDDEYALVRHHPQAGWEMLSRVPGIEPVALEVALHHHEKFDGSGYPDGISREGIDLFARMGAVCDVYDAVTSCRAYNRGWDPGETVRRMATWDGHFDPMIFHAFVRAVGIYPVGSLVRLASGRLAVVLAQAGESLLTPTVRPFYDIAADERIVAPPITLDRSSGDRIVSREDPVAWGFEGLDALWMDAGN